MDITSLISSADEYALKAEKERNISHIIHSNSLKKRVKEKETDFKDIETKIEEKLLELKNTI